MLMPKRVKYANSNAAECAAKPCAELKSAMANMLCRLSTGWVTARQIEAAAVQ